MLAGGERFSARIWSAIGRLEAGATGCALTGVRPLRRAGLRAIVDPFPGNPYNSKSACPTARFTEWGCSSVGRALVWQTRGQGFDSPHLHHFCFFGSSLRGWDRRWNFRVTSMENLTLNEGQKYVELTFLVEKEPDEELYSSVCKELDVASCGSSIEDALDNLREAVLLHLTDR